MKGILLVFSIILLRSCGGASTDYKTMLVQQNKGTNQKELFGTYKIKTLNNENVSQHKLQITFNDSTKQVSGFSGCNQFFGSYALKKSSLKFSKLGLTRMSCKGEVNAIETNLIGALQNANIVLIKDDEFSIYNKKKLLLTAVKEVKLVFTLIEYSAISKDSFKLIQINNKTISFSSKQGEEPSKSIIDRKHWNTIAEATKNINIENLPNLEAPSKGFLHDGAALGRIKVISNGKTYESCAFDHGNPPKEIATLVKEILSLTENIE